MGRTVAHGAAGRPLGRGIIAEPIFGRGHLLGGRPVILGYLTAVTSRSFEGPYRRRRFVWPQRLRLALGALPFGVVEVTGPGLLRNIIWLLLSRDTPPSPVTTFTRSFLQEQLKNWRRHVCTVS